MTREERVIDMRNRALGLVNSRGIPTGEMTREYTKAGMTIQQSLITVTQIITIATSAGNVVAVELDSNGRFRVLVYEPGLWETKLKHLTRRGQH